jgi:aerobic-type carbon monoxide dehydrogenase small subunit (CoxS/CutS family)
MTLSLSINDQAVAVDADPSTPLLWVLRDHLGMTGTKFGCGIAQCGACTVHINDRAMRSCQFPLEAAVGTRIRTIEGLSPDSSHPLQRLWVAMNVPSQAHRRRYRSVRQQYLPVRHLPAHSRGHSQGCRSRTRVRGRS